MSHISITERRFSMKKYIGQIFLNLMKIWGGTWIAFLVSIIPMYIMRGNNVSKYTEYLVDGIISLCVTAIALFYYCVWDGHTVTSEVKTKSYKVNENNCRPIFNDFTYADTNATTVALTGNNQKVVKGYSNVTATVSVANKAELNATYPADSLAGS